MDKELLARRIYVERVTAILGDESVDEAMLEQMWEDKIPPSDVAKAMQAAQDPCFEGAPWLQRYLNRR
jgi:hypothetical protein